MSFEGRRTWVDGTEFHAEKRPWYGGALSWAIVKREAQMAGVAYEPSHSNPAEDGARAGLARWVFCDRDGDGEGIFSTPLRLFIDSWLDPHASIGLHEHADSEEIYYLLEGELTIVTVAPDGREDVQTLRPHDAHAVLLGQSHSAEAGPDGARFLSIALDHQKEPTHG
jgi:mannose-6-phosphate isomerase-like protein (cupin superfamily)